MSVLTAVVLGLVQGIAEFLPISSSGHLAIAEHLLNMQGASNVPNFSMCCSTSARSWRCLPLTGTISAI